MRIFNEIKWHPGLLMKVKWRLLILNTIVHSEYITPVDSFGHYFSGCEHTNYIVCLLQIAKSDIAKIKNSVQCLR